MNHFFSFEIEIILLNYGISMFEYVDGYATHVCMGNESWKKKINSMEKSILEEFERKKQH